MWSILTNIGNGNAGIKTDNFKMGGRAAFASLVLYS